jgi:hypothetical protein
LINYKFLKEEDVDLEIYTGRNSEFFSLPAREPFGPNQPEPENSFKFANHTRPRLGLLFIEARMKPDLYNICLDCRVVRTNANNLSMDYLTTLELYLTSFWRLRI